jgi:hypothetical protein
MKRQLHKYLVNVVSFVSFFIYYVLLIVLVTIAVVDTPETIALDKENGIGPTSGFAIMYLTLSGIGPLLSIVLPLISLGICKKAKQKSWKLFKYIIFFHVALLLVFWLRFRWIM